MQQIGNTPKAGAGGHEAASEFDESVYKLLRNNPNNLSDQELLLTNDYTSVSKQIGIRSLNSAKDVGKVSRAISQAENSTEQPQNLVIFIRDQVKPEDLWLPRDWAKENLPTRQWLLDNGLSFENSFTNTAMCSSARATFFTGKYPAQHELDLLLSDIENPILDSEVQLNPDLPTLGTVLGDLGYDVSFFGKTHLSKTFTTVDGEVVYQDMSQYDFQDWQGPDAGQDMDPKNAGGGYADNDTRFIGEATTWLNNRLDSGNTKPFAMVVSLVNPHDVLAYPRNWGEGDPNTYFGYSVDMIQGDIDILPPTVDEPITGSMTAEGYDFSGNYKPQIQREWLRIQAGAQPLPTDELKLNYLNFYGNLMKIADAQMGEVITTL
ncbi:MAG: sulfatase-like hydrolase/transferase, partial [Cyanobium sp. MAG_255]|nr:sulfatase-like hydrolase/transferase [Cyanobium sp. MAG_255]